VLLVQVDLVEVLATAIRGFKAKIRVGKFDLTLYGFVFFFL
jgi:hypothetical protein